jgi:exopolysaccharide production protein ExoQ
MNIRPRSSLPATAFPASTGTSLVRQADAGFILQLLFAFGLAFLTPAFVRQLAFDPVTFEFRPSLVFQLVNTFCGVFGVVMVATSRDVSQTLRRSWPILTLVGLAFLSGLWSIDFRATFRASTVLLFTTLFSVALAGRLSPASRIRLVIRTLVVLCGLSIVWIVLYPDEAIHQMTDPFQWQHAGLWRGVFSHKQGLGVVAGLTFGLMVFYGSIAFTWSIFRYAALACCISCLYGTQSFTGILTAVIFPIILYILYKIVHLPHVERRNGLIIFTIFLSLFYICFHFELFNFLLPTFGKSSDLTGRAGNWPWVLASLRNSGAALLGGGYASNFDEIVAPEISIDNGYIEVLVAFGYLGGAVIFAVYAWVLWNGAKLILLAEPAKAAIQIFPLGVMLIELFINISEATFMTKSIHTVLIVTSIYQIVSDRPKAAGSRPTYRRT